MADLLSDLLEDYLERRAKGEAPQPEEYRERAGADYADFVDLLAAESALDSALLLESATPLPADFGNYTLLTEIGRGAVGVVYEALHKDLGRTVAVKVLRTGFDTAPEAIERFRREAVACAQVRHDNIVEIYESGDVDGRPFYAMALLRGQSLSQLIRGGSMPTAQETCRRLASVADALHTLHEHGVIHRDIKPSNIMIEESGRMVLADFGLARTLVSAALTKTGEALGTPLYMSPEQLMGRGEEVNRRSDVYGLGATLYEALAGHPPFVADDFQTMIREILEEKPRRLRDAAPHIPRDCERIVMKAIEKRNDDRYQTAAAMRDDLLAFAEGRSTVGRPVSALVHRARWAKRRWKELTIAAAVLVTAGVLYSTRAATLRVDCYPSAEVLVDGERRGLTPQELELSPGEHELTLRTSGFVASSERLDLRAGETHTLRIVLIADDPDNPEALRKLARKFEFAIASLDRSARKRGTPTENKAVPSLPRGLVRSTINLEIRVDVGSEFEAEGTLEFFADGKRIHTQAFEPDSLTTTLPLPAAVRTAAAGHEIEWGFYPKGSSAAHSTTTFRMAADDLEAQIQEMAKALGKQDPRLIANMRANLFLKHELFHAAYREATASLKQGPLSEHACAILQAALRGMRLEGSPLWNEMYSYVDRLQGN